MARRQLTFFDESSEPLERRIATGLHKLGLAMKQQTWLQANEEGVSPTQGQILSAVAISGALSGTELAQRLGVSLPTISDSVRVLVEKQLVAKKPDPRHARASLVELTVAGRAQAAKVRSWPEFLASAVSTMSEAEQSVFLSGLLKMIRTLQENGQIPTNRMCITCVHFRPNVREWAKPHHCAFVDAPMAAHHLRIDCAEHDLAAAEQQAATWERFTTARS
jgi:DNA-binding MarR family transcriptional regulator